MKRQKGQSLIEFAITFPLFMLIFMAIVYAGCFFADYLTLSNIARDSARQAALGTSADKVRSRYSSSDLITSLYTWSPSDTQAFSITSKTDTSLGNIVVVQITATRNHSVLYGVMNLFLPETVQINYHMYDETKDTTSSKTT